MRLVNIYVRHGRAFIPVQAQSESGIFVNVEPVFTGELEASKLADAITRVMEHGHPRLTSLAVQQQKGSHDPVLRAAGVKSWKQFATDGTAYVIGWSEREIRIDMTRLDKRGRWEYDPERARAFPRETPLTELVATVLADIAGR